MKHQASALDSALDIAELQQFLAELYANNAKAWFDANKPRYDALRKQFAELVGDVIARTAAFDPLMQTLAAKDTMFRINRDVRFSSNKAPYKTQFSAALCPQGKKTDLPAYYFHINHAGTLFVGGGMYMPEAQNLRRIRENIAASPEQVEAVLAHPLFKKTYGSLDASMTLVRLPKGYYDDVPHPELVKLKGFFAGNSIESTTQDYKQLMRQPCGNDCGAFSRTASVGAVAACGCG
jgi:uncharacterized protein (TIGR02453 family)